MATAAARPKPGRSAEEIAALMAAYEQSGLTRREYCQRQGLAFSTFDYYRYRWRRPKRKRPPLAPPKLVEVKIAPAPPADSGTAAPWSVLLRHERRIAVLPGFDAEELTRLIRAVERA